MQSLLPGLGHLSQCKKDKKHFLREKMQQFGDTHLRWKEHCMGGEMRISRSDPKKREKLQLQRGGTSSKILSVRQRHPYNWSDLMIWRCWACWSLIVFPSSPMASKWSTFRIELSGVRCALLTTPFLEKYFIIAIERVSLLCRVTWVDWRGNSWWWKGKRPLLCRKYFHVLRPPESFLRVICNWIIFGFWYLFFAYCTLYYSMIFSDCNVRTQYSSAPQHTKYLCNSTFRRSINGFQPNLNGERKWCVMYKLHYD